MQHSSSWVCELESSVNFDPVSPNHAEHGREELMQILVKVGAGTAVMLSAEACLISALAR